MVFSTYSNALYQRWQCTSMLSSTTFSSFQDDDIDMHLNLYSLAAQVCLHRPCSCTATVHTQHAYLYALARGRVRCAQWAARRKVKGRVHRAATATPTPSSCLSHADSLTQCCVLRLLLRCSADHVLASRKARGVAEVLPHIDDLMSAVRKPRDRRGRVCKR